MNSDFEYENLYTTKKQFKVEKLWSRFSQQPLLEARVFSGNGQIGSWGWFHQHFLLTFSRMLNEKLFSAHKFGERRLAKFDIILALTFSWWNWTANFLPNAVRWQLFAWRTKFGEIDPSTSCKNLNLFFCSPFFSICPGGLFFASYDSCHSHSGFVSLWYVLESRFATIKNSPLDFYGNIMGPT